MSLFRVEAIYCSGRHDDGILDARCVDLLVCTEQHSHDGQDSIRNAQINELSRSSKLSHGSRQSVLQTAGPWSPLGNTRRCTIIDILVGR